MKLGGERGPQLTRAAGARYDFAALWEAAPATLEEIFLRGSTPHAADIAGWEYRGRNHAPIAEVIRVKRFTKVFSPLPPAPTVNPAPVISGHNLWVEQAGGPRDPWIPLTREGRPWRHGWYEVVPVDPRTVDGRYPHALLIDYGRGANPWHHPTRVLRDYVVQVYPDDPSLLVGKAYAALGSLRVLAGHFTMLRVAPAPRDG